MGQQGEPCPGVAQRVDGRQMSGMEVVNGEWKPVEVAIDAAYDRFPGQAQADTWRAAHSQLAAAGVPVGNPPEIVELCRDKWACQQYLDAAGVAGLPPVEKEPDRFADCLADWGAGFLKPRFGSFGAGVRPVFPGEPLPAQVAGLGPPEPALLQFAVPAPPGWAGWSARILTQRIAPLGHWIPTPTVLRRSRTDPVVNAARGAELCPAGDALSPHDHAFARGLAITVSQVIGEHPRGSTLLELGVDLVIDREGQAWVVEVNGRPAGRLEGLARQDPATWGPAHEAALQRPFLYLASLVGHTP